MEALHWLSQIIHHEYAKLALSAVWSVYLLVVGVWILLQRRAPVATLGWLLSMALLPVVGLVVYYFLGPRRFKRQRIKRLRSRNKVQLRTSIERMRSHLPHAPERIQQIARLATAATDLPVSSADKVELLSGGAATFDAIMDSVRQAQHHIHLEYYIFEPDQTGTALRDALIERARAGVQVRLLVDSLGSKRIHHQFYAPLEAAGGQFAVFHPSRFGRRLRPVTNFRTHRKIMVCDGRVGYTGGVNITDEEDKRIDPQAYHDVHVRLEGPVVNWLQTVFMEDWAYVLERKNLPTEIGYVDALLPDMPEGDHMVQVITSGPDMPLEAIHRVHVSSIHASTTRLWLTTPYFVPTEAGRMALSSAALRGVDVRVLVPKLSDSRIVTAAARSYFDELIATGVKVYEYKARMLHSKSMVVDDNLSIIGTANFDNRSFLLNYEVCVIAYGPSLTMQLAQQFEQDLLSSERVHGGRPQHFLQRLGDSLARLFSPLL